MERILEGKVAVITGNAQGIGKGISLELARYGADIVGNHVDLSMEAMSRAEMTRQQIEALGVRAFSIPADVSTKEGRQFLLQETLNISKRVNILVLNAARGLQKGKPANWAEIMNVEAQLALVEGFLPYMSKGNVIIYPTSLWAHEYGKVKQLPAYGEVARTKYMAEMAFKEMIPDLTKKGILMRFLCGYLVAGTGAHQIFRANYPDLVGYLESKAEGGRLPDIFDMGRGARELVLSGEPSGSILFIGGIYADPIEHRGAIKLDNLQIRKELPMYGLNKLRVDAFESGEDPKQSISKYVVKPADLQSWEENPFDSFEISEEGKGVARRTTQEGETDGHFSINGQEERIYRGVDLIKDAAKAVMLTWKYLNKDLNGMPVFTGASSFVFDNMVFPENRLTFETTVVSEGPDSIVSDCEIKIGDIISVARIEGIECSVQKGDAPIDPNNELLEIAAQSLILTWQTSNTWVRGVPVFRGGENFKFYDSASAGDKLTISSVITYEGSNNVIGESEIRIGDKLLAKMNGIEGQLIPNIEIAQAEMRRQRNLRRKATRFALAAENLPV